MRLGEGGMGRVYLGRSPGGRTVAVKLVHAGLVGMPGFRERFAREVRASRAVSGTGTVPVVAADPDAAIPWLASAYVPGPSLAEAVHQHGPLPEASLWRLLSGLAEALEAVHACGLVHRDLKPSNVLLSLDRPLLIDFGIARAADGADLTGTGLVVGSPGYMSPEQAEGREVGAASDVFSLGAVLVHAATGRAAFGSGTGPVLLYRIVHHDPDLSGLPDAFAVIVRECLEKSPERRPSPAALRARAEAARPSGGADWLPAPVASAIARKAEHLLNLDGEEHAGTDGGRASAPPAVIATEMDPRPALDPHAVPTRMAAGSGVPAPPPRQAPSRPGPPRGRGFRALPWVIVAAVAAVTVGVIAADTDGDSTPPGAGPHTTSPHPTQQVTAPSTAPTTKAPAKPTTADPTESATEEPSPLAGKWRGSYYCSKGETGLILTISQNADDLTATFDFYPLPSNPGLSRGSFALRGTHAGTRMRLFAERWLQQPEGYEMVGLSAEVGGKSPRTITGSVTNADGTPRDSCSTFTVEKN
ncbi:serine/threonine-protein kinase [Streptomyces sp. TBY4]|uniref:serine/threonine-protein kinase n=1 Tax=Streptomyces sp. TBY4 TaxID=2962030 RepID=UPI0020B78364|nr:serine/threonine-protein kinase [Streptomyces sp. TBY4]MCP3757113.1 protein kinase [Streptomyces sp. TBY4]